MGTRRGTAAILAALVLAVVAPDVAVAGEPSPEYQAAIRRTVELRRSRRQAQSRRPIGTIQMYPMPPALIIRHTSETHDEVRALLDMLRSAGP